MRVHSQRDFANMCSSDTVGIGYMLLGYIINKTLYMNYARKKGLLAYMVSFHTTKPWAIYPVLTVVRLQIMCLIT